MELSKGTESQARRRDQSLASETGGKEIKAHTELEKEFEPGYVKKRLRYLAGGWWEEEGSSGNFEAKPHTVHIPFVKFSFHFFLLYILNF